MFATTASISGDISSDSATLGKFTLDNTSIVASGSRMILDAQNYAIQLSDSSLTPLVNINAGESLASPSAGSGITSNWYTTAVSTISGNASSGDNTTYQKRNNRLPIHTNIRIFIPSWVISIINITFW